jgi:hypothetical protein
MSTRLQGGRRVRLTISPPSVSRLPRENVWTSTSRKPMGLHGLLQAQLYISLHFAGLLDVQNILSVDTGISRKTKDHSLGDHLINESVTVTPLSVIEASIVLFLVFVTRVSQCCSSMRSEQTIYIYIYIKLRGFSPLANYTDRAIAAIYIFCIYRIPWGKTSLAA